jgi:hypothetical protein
MDGVFLVTCDGLCLTGLVVRLVRGNVLLVTLHGTLRNYYLSLLNITLTSPSQCMDSAQTWPGIVLIVYLFRQLLPEVCHSF